MNLFFMLKQWSSWFLREKKEATAQMEIYFEKNQNLFEEK